jgi:hypothetical protein
MKISLPIMVLVTVISLSAPVYSQSGETKVEYQKTDKTAATIEFPYTAEIVEDAIKEYMGKKGGKSDHVKSFDVYRNARLAENDPEIVDVHFKVDRKIVKERETSVVYMLIGRPGENVGVRATDDRFKVSDAKELLNSIAPYIDAYNLEVQIKKQEEVVRKSEKRLLNLKDDQYDLDKRLKTLQEKIAQNKNDQLLQTEDLNRQKDALTTIQNKKDISQGKQVSRQ